MKKIIKRFIPKSLLARVHSVKIARLRREFAELSMGATFSKIYSEKLWGEGQDEFCSGSGSSGHVAKIYVDYVSQFILENEIKTIVDLGCGDFRIGRIISKISQEYTGIDVVPELISHHVANFSTETVQFRCLDITKEDLPKGDLCLVRQVLQHLSNAEIAVVLQKLSIYRYVLITEHFPQMNAAFAPNTDKPHGPDTRLIDNSAVVLTAPPFSLQQVQEVLAVEVNDGKICQGDTIRTFLYEGHDRQMAAKSTRTAM